MKQVLGFGNVTSVSVGNNQSNNGNSIRVAIIQAEHPQVYGCNGGGVCSCGINR